MSSMKQSLLVILSETGFVKKGIRVHDIRELGRKQGSDGVVLALGQASFQLLGMIGMISCQRGFACGMMVA